MIKFFNANQVAILLNISKQTLLRYEQKGIFPRAKRNNVNNWREYTENDVYQLRAIMGRNDVHQLRNIMGRES